MKRAVKLFALLTAVMLLSGCSDIARWTVNIGREVANYAKADIAELTRKYDNVADFWRNEYVMGDNKAAYSAVTQLLKDADSGNKERFANTFTKDVREKDDFSEKLDTFFENFPAGLSECKLKSTGGGIGEGSIYDGMVYDDYSTSYTCELNGEWIHIRIDVIYQNMADPENAGVTLFRVQNEGGYVQELKWDRDYLECLILSQEEAPTRHINDRLYSFTPTPGRVITEEDVRAALKECKRLAEIESIFGKPNATSAYDVYDTDYCYELEPQDGEPRYAYIYERHITLFGYVCSDKEKLYSLIEK